MEDDTPLVTITCSQGHALQWFRCKQGKNKGKIYWKSQQCRSFYNNNYIQALAPYDSLEHTVRCMGPLEPK